MDEKEFIENFGMTREEYAEKYGVLEDPNLGKDKTLRQKSVDKVAGALQNLGFDQYLAYNQANRILGNYENPITEGGIGVLDFTPVQIPFAAQEAKRAYDKGDYVESALTGSFSALETLPFMKLVSTPIKSFFKSLGSKVTSETPIDPSRRKALGAIAAAPVAVGALSEVPVEKIVDDFDFIDEVDKLPIKSVAKKIALPKDFNPISDLSDVKEIIDDIIRLDIEDDIDEFDDIDDTIEQTSLSKRTEIAQERSISEYARIPENAINQMIEDYGSSDEEIIEILEKFFDFDSEDAEELIQIVREEGV